MNDDQMSDLFDRASRGVVADVDSLVAGGLARGRRRRARHRWEAAAGAVSIVGVVGLATLVPAGGGAPSGRGLDVATAPSASTSEPASGHQRGPGDPRVVPFDPAKTAWVLGTLLPGGETDDHVWHGGASPLRAGDRGYQAGSVVWHGGLVEVLVESAADSGDSTTAERRCRTSGAVGTCEPIGDGDWIRPWSFAESEQNVETGVVGNHVEVFTHDGFHVSVSAYNAPQEKAAGTTSVDPVLSIVELRGLALARAWIVHPHATPARR